MELGSRDSLTRGSLDNSLYEWAVCGGTHGKRVIPQESSLVEGVVLIAGAWRLRCDAVDALLPSVNVVLLVQDQ